jgi:DNA helicase HerA-like ATPase
MAKNVVIRIGTYDGPEKEPALINFERAVNPHMIFLGGSGSGKTYMMRTIIRILAMSKRNRIHIFDVHGDIAPDGEIASHAKISQTSEMGLQPLKLSLDPDYGGVNRAIKQFIRSINNSTHKLGTRQESTLRKLMLELYRANGFYAEDPRTWGLDHDPWPGRKHPKRYPDFDDLLRFSRSKYKQMVVGASGEAVRALEAFLKKSALFNKKRISYMKDEISEEELESAKAQAIETYEHYLSSPNNDKVLDEMIRYSSKEVLASIVDRLETLEATGIFKKKPIEHDPRKPIWRYDISSLSVDDQRTFINLKLYEIFLEAKQKGIGHSPDTFCFVDEVRNYIFPGEECMIRKFFLEARKFGVGMAVAAQNVEHLDDDIITSAGTKMILGVDPMHTKSFSRKLHLDEEIIRGIVPKKSVLLNAIQNGKPNRFRKVILE